MFEPITAIENYTPIASEFNVKNYTLSYMRGKINTNNISAKNQLKSSCQINQRSYPSNFSNTTFLFFEFRLLIKGKKFLKNEKNTMKSQIFLLHEKRLLFSPIRKEIDHMIPNTSNEDVHNLYKNLLWMSQKQ